jgi:hypothetical protein
LAEDLKLGGVETTMEFNDVQRMATSVLREYGVPMKVSGISAVETGWTIAFAGFYPGSPALEVNVASDRSSAHHVRESLKRSLAVSD